MLQIYHVPGTRGTRVIWLCEELNVPYEVTLVDFSAEYRASPEWRALNPTGKVPVMTDGDIKMFESGAMMDYVLQRYGQGRLQPHKDAALLAEYLQWHWFAEATLARPLGEIVNHGREFPGDKRITAVVEEMANRAGVCLEAVAQHMQGKQFLLGDVFSAADISMGYSLLIAELLAPEKFPNQLQPYWQRLQSRPGFAAARQDFS
ncbi:MAG: glutathione S-transferase [Candidatus Azotimanducaceae bacterium]|jgi:glutathione S-transferase